MNDFGDHPSLDDIARSDAFLDALAGGRQAAATDDTDAMLAAMLGDWRDELRWPPESELISEDAAFAAIQSGMVRTPSRNTGRGRRHLGVVGAAAAAVLCLGGFGAVVAGSGPGDALYGLRSMLFGAPKQVRDDQVALAAQAELYQVQQMIARGDWQQAQERLVAVSNTVAAVGDQQQKQELFNQWNQLSARVVERNPEATVPPGITYTVLPSVNQLVPTAAPTTLPSMPPITLAIPSEESPSEPVVSEPVVSEPVVSEPVVSATGSPSPNPSATTEPPAATSSVPTDLPSTSAPTSPVQETQQASTSAEAPTSASPTPSAATSAPATSAPATSAPATSAPATSAPATSAPATSAPATSAPVTSAQQSSAASSEPATTAAPTSTTAANSATATTTVPAASPTQSAASATPSAQQTKQSTPTIVTTTAAGS